MQWEGGRWEGGAKNNVGVASVALWPNNRSFLLARAKEGAMLLCCYVASMARM